MIFLDSSILVEYTKDEHTVFLEEMLQHNIPLYYNDIVLTEYTYHYIGYYGKKAPRTLKENGSIPDILKEHTPMTLLCLFEQKMESYPSAQDVIRLMKTYNLLPNDAIILAHCLEAKIPYLASYDTDFGEPCRHEGVTLLDSAEAFHTYFPVS